MTPRALRPSLGEIVGDQVGAFGAVISGVYVRSATEARTLRAALDAALDSAVSNEAASALNRWLEEVDTMLRRAAKERWVGWESVHAA